MSQSPNPADMLGPNGVIDAQKQGRAAALAGNGPDACPWKTPAADREHAQRAMWIRGYAQGRTELRHAGEHRESPRQSPPEQAPDSAKPGKPLSGG
ncbi:ribosome modulation factor [Lentzea terrae]|uniref:ribosome modulation factor n=1 Tax=Lentzea terrae TaxID=2200761 RepID=UPI0013003BC9|nr:Rmf/CrpP family protein [Lentzea terrae]